MHLAKRENLSVVYASIFIALFLNIPSTLLIFGYDIYFPRSGFNLIEFIYQVLCQILFSCLIMMYGLIINKKQQNQKEILSPEIENQEEELSNQV